MRPLLFCLFPFCFSFHCFGQKVDTIQMAEKYMNGLWISTTKSASHWDSLYLGDDGVFYSAQYQEDSIADYHHKYGRWWITNSDTSVSLNVGCINDEERDKLVRYDYRSTIIPNVPLLIMDEEWHKVSH